MAALWLVVPLTACRAPIDTQPPVRGSDDELRWVDESLVFAEPVELSTAGLACHWRLGSRSVWIGSDVVLVVDDGSRRAVRITGFPRELGPVRAAGWEGDVERRFFVHVSAGADFGTMLWIDLERQEVTEVEWWFAW